MTITMIEEPEFGHVYYSGSGLCIDSWGIGPFVIAIEGKSYRFEDSDRFGPALVKRNRDPIANPWPSPRCPFWRAHRIWKLQGRRTEGGTNCIWDEPKPQTIRMLNKRNAIIVEAGEEDGKTIVLGADG